MIRLIQKRHRLGSLALLLCVAIGIPCLALAQDKATETNAPQPQSGTPQWKSLLTPDGSGSETAQTYLQIVRFETIKDIRSNGQYVLISGQGSAQVNNHLSLYRAMDARAPALHVELTITNIKDPNWPPCLDLLKEAASTHQFVDISGQGVFNAGYFQLVSIDSCDPAQPSGPDPRLPM